jgi:tetratricopeptide (TPR) repeat protein
MNHIRTSLFFIFSFVSFYVQAQNTIGYSEAEIFYRNGIELYEKSNYTAARQEFVNYLEKRTGLFNTNDYNAIIAEYYIAVCGLYANDPAAELLIDRFVKNHPSHPKAAVIYTDLGTYYFELEDYSKAITYFEKALRQSQSYYLGADTKYKLALSYYSTQQFDEALDYFKDLLNDPDTKYYAPSAYYSGVISYRNGDYKTSYRNFKLIENNPQYKADMPNWIVASLFRAGRFDEVLTYAEPILKREKGGGIKLNDVALYVAEVYYNRGDFANAATNYALLNKYKTAKLPAPIQFRYGHSLFKTNNFTAAVEQLKGVATQKDTIGQYSSFILGISQLQNKNPQAALTALDNAARLNFNKAIKEEASFNHAKLQLDQNNNNAAIAELQEYLKTYSNGLFEKESQKLLIRAFSSANNNAAAIGYIEGLKKIDDEFKAAYQRLTYNQGIGDFNNERYAQAIVNFDKSLKYTPNDDIQSTSVFQKGEAYSALSRYGEAMPQYAQAIRSGGVNAVKSYYSLGYAYYNTKDYKNALVNFKNFLDKQPTDRQAVEDATIRMADCYLIEKNYDQAMQLYDKAIGSGKLDRDYALYQKGLILTYQEKDTEAKAQFDKVILQFSTSRYADDALFQSANIDLEKNNYQVAIRSYSKLIKEKPKSYLVPPALLKRALAYNNIQVYEEAIKDYRRILNEFSDSPSAKDALLGLQATLETAGRSDEMSDVLADFKKKNPESTETERIEFETAKSLFSNEKYPQAIKSLQNFVRDYPNSDYDDEVKYYIAESYYRTNDFNNALRFYYQVVTDGQSKFVSKSALRAGDIEVKQQNLNRAIRNYYILYTQSENKTDQVTGQIRLMDTYFKLKKYDSTTYFANQVLAAGDVIPGSSKKAQMNIGKVYLEKGDYKTATDEFKKMYAISKDEFGAESKYWYSDALYRQKKYKEAQTSILELNKQYADYDFWRVRGFILLADVYLGLNDPDQAKATLQSVIENSEDKEIIEMAKAKLATIQ